MTREQQAESILREALRRLSGASPQSARPAAADKLRDLGYRSAAEIDELKAQIAGIVREMVAPEVIDLETHLDLLPDETLLDTRLRVTLAVGRLPGKIIPPPDKLPARASGDSLYPPDAALAGDPLYPPDDDKEEI